ncbi:hypothetical protein J2TS6_48450 [Paenibacillus albilobatus]|uniref:Uncharacterized protein n=1 Tax=Paenibacillus albilobatus TaxID=2716884 RepID=A0A919XL10_9BACL|nr:hypothetical protein [Paenibacillus albilobatus]GIO33704.1 hypothetical protein J2TS6_48450 [Paenibacillus albilobatus]
MGVTISARSESELFQMLRSCLSPEIRTDIDRYLYAYEMYLDEPDPAAREVLLGEMKCYERKYNLEFDHKKSRPEERTKSNYPNR